MKAYFTKSHFGGKTIKKKIQGRKNPTKRQNNGSLLQKGKVCDQKVAQGKGF